MIELFTGLGTLALLLGWTFGWRAASVRRARERIADLHDRVLLGYFQSHGLSVEHPLYVQLSTLLEGQLRKTGAVTPWEIAYFWRAIAGRPDLLDEVMESVDRKLETEDPDLKRLIIEIREESSDAVLTCMRETSFTAILMRLLRKAPAFHRKLNLKSRMYLELTALAH